MLFVNVISNYFVYMFDVLAYLWLSLIVFNNLWCSIYDSLLFCAQFVYLRMFMISFAFHRFSLVCFEFIYLSLLSLFSLIHLLPFLWCSLEFLDFLRFFNGLWFSLAFFIIVSLCNALIIFYYLIPFLLLFDFPWISHMFLEFLKCS